MTACLHADSTLKILNCAVRHTSLITCYLLPEKKAVLCEHSLFFSPLRGKAHRIQRGDTMNFAVLGGDERSRRLCRLLKEDGHTVKSELYPDCAAAVLPLVGEAPDIRVPAGCTVFGKGHRELLKCESFALENAALTALGALQLLLEDTETALQGKKALILGYGRIGKMLLPKLQALGLSVTVAARRESERTLARLAGAESCSFSALPGAQFIFNTVPSPVLDSSELERQQGAYIMELASAPYGFDMAEAERAGLRCRMASALPGKLFPEAAAELMRNTIYNILEMEK